jgi:flagellin
MSLRINYNGAADNAWRHLNNSNNELQGSVEKLSSGLRINKGADDPAGLIISERLKAQITGLGQAVQNAQEATSLVQTGEGALTEMNNMLNKMRGLAVHSSNTGVNDSDTIAADQSQVDSALDSLQKIAVNTKYQAKTLLDGSASNTASVADTFSNSYSSVDVEGSVTNLTGAVSVQVTQVAKRADAVGGGFAASHGTATLTIDSSDFDAVTVNIASSASLGDIVDTINTTYDQTGVWASTNGSGQLDFTFSAYGDNHNITITSDAANVIASSGNASMYAVGQDADGTLQATVDGSATTLSMTGNGLNLTVDSGAAALVGTTVTLVGANADVADDTNRAGAGDGLGGDNKTTGNNAFTVSAGQLEFSLGQDASSSEIRTLSIQNMQVNEMGKDSTLSGSSLNAIRTGGKYSLANDAANAVKIIDKAIDDVSITRANLGAFQQNALETTINTLSINKENLEASNSRIADVDMAQEMMKFTKNQILTQAGTAMLAQANQLPRSVLQLLQ